MTSKSTTPEKSRRRLIELLWQASQAEHSLCCQYLFAAFSLRRTRRDYDGLGLPDNTVSLAMSATQRWATEIYFVARQEMEHLGMATNMLSAIGEQPYLWHGDYPDQALARILQAPQILAPFNGETMRRFQFIERPKGLLRGPDPAVETIYLEIQQLFQELPAAELFTGDGERQVTDQDFELGVSMKILPVTNRASASAAVNLVLSQGEGLGDSPLVMDTHFAAFTQVLEELRETLAALGPHLGDDRNFAWPTVPNPVSKPGPDGTTLVTSSFSAEVMQLFDEGYRLMLIMLAEFFWGFRGYSGMFEAVAALATAEQRRAHRRVEILSENAFFPFMTMFIRPLGELLVRQPAFEDSRNPARAGPSFSTGGDVPLWTDMDRYLDAMTTLQRHAGRLAAAAPDADARDVLVYLDQNLHRMRLNIANVWRQVG